ncbi:MAG: hypothetical protein GY772_00850 [bacterium]|nr:hypothetical protein [bacterium]
MGRVVLLMRPLIETMQHIARTRVGSQPAKDAEQFLGFIDTERTVTLGMLADAGDESLRLTRIYDGTNYDPAGHERQLAEFAARVQFLFVQGHCTSMGYTGEALKSLRRVHTFNIRGRPKSVGGEGAVTPELLERCMQRMRRWVWLATATVRAEFPAWDFPSLFAMMDIDRFMSQACPRSSRTARRGDVDAAEAVPPASASQTLDPTAFARAAKVFAVSQSALTQEWEEVLPLAWHVKQQAGGTLSNAACFQTVVTDWLSRSTCRAGVYRTGAFQTVLTAYIASHGLSTSDVERMHGVQKRRMLHRDLAAEARENDELAVLAIVRPDEVADCIRRAQTIWSLLYGKPRRRLQARRDKGKPRRKVRRAA